VMSFSVSSGENPGAPVHTNIHGKEISGFISLGRVNKEYVPITMEAIMMMLTRTGFFMEIFAMLI